MVTSLEHILKVGLTVFNDGLLRGAPEREASQVAPRLWLQQEVNADASYSRGVLTETWSWV